MLRGSIDRVPDQEGLGIGWLARRLPDLCMCAQRDSLAGWLAVKGVNWGSGLATGGPCSPRMGGARYAAWMAAESGVDRSWAQRITRLCTDGRPRAAVLWAAGCQLRAEREWEGVRSDGAFGVLALVFQISHPRLAGLGRKDGSLGASRTLHERHRQVQNIYSC